MKKILLVDDNDTFREATQRSLESLGYEVICAIHGADAKAKLPSCQADAVLSDIRMPKVDGLELMKHVKATTSLPVILMTGFSEILETKTAYELGADEFIAKPFPVRDLERALLRCFDIEEGPRENQEYMKVAIGDFLSGREVKHNIFIRLSEKKFVKIAYKGEDLSMDRIRAYRAKGINYLYLRKEDFKEYVGFALNLVEASRTKRNIAPEKRRNLVRHAGEVLMEQVMQDGIDQDLFSDTSSFVESCLEVVTESQDIAELLDSLGHFSDEIYGHCVAVSLYSVLIARKLKWMTAKNNFKVAVGGLLHDVGLKEISYEILTKPRAQWTHDEVTAYESHCMRGVDILSSIEGIPDDVIRIVQEHHEDCISSGFPLRPKPATIHPMSKVVAAANEFCRRAIKSPSSPGMDPKKAIELMETQCAGRLDSASFNALKALFSK